MVSENDLFYPLASCNEVVRGIRKVDLAQVWFHVLITLYDRDYGSCCRKAGWIITSEILQTIIANKNHNKKDPSVINDYYSFIMAGNFQHIRDFSSLSSIYFIIC